MKTIELVRGLKEKNINIESRDGELDIIVNENNLSEDLLNCIKKNKSQLLDYLENSRIKRSTSDFTYDGLKLKEYKKILLDNNISDSNVDDIFNLTPLQEGFLFHSILNSNSLAYFEQISLDLQGDLDISNIRESWNQVVNRHDPLRTVFISDSRVPLQIVLKNRELDFKYLDIREDNDKDKNLIEIKKIDRNDTFDLKIDPLFRIKLVQGENDKYTLIISFHHIILDGWCMPILISEFLDNYYKLRNGEDLILEFPPKYSEYISWLNKRESEADREYWKSYLGGYEELATIPKDSLVDYQGDEQHLNYSFSIDKELTRSIKAFASEIGVTFNTIIQTIWGVVLSRYNNTDDVVFGSTVSGRPQEIDRIDEMVGLFINTIPVRIKADNDKRFEEVAVDIQRGALESIDYQHSSLAEIQSDCGLNNGLFDHIMVFENYPIDESLKRNSSTLLEIGNVDSFEQTNYDFNISVFPDECLDFRFCYNPKKYSRESLDRIASHIRKAILEILSDKEITVGAIDIIPEEEKSLLLHMFNDTKVDYPANKTIIDLFEEQVERTPGNIAVVFENVELSYKELNEKANIVGHYLKDNHDIDPDDLVGVLLDRSEKLIIALLGILKSGAAYVPFDPDYPVDRINYMLEDSNPKVVLCDREEDLFTDINEILNCNSKSCNLDNNKNSDNLAYVIYTSGSTGKPKGVMIHEKSIVNFLFAFSGQFENGITEIDNFISIVNASFDVSVCEIFSSLVFGARLFIYKDITLDLKVYCRYMVDNEITFAYIHPGLLKDVAKNLNKEKIALNKLLVGVEGIQDTTLNEYLDLGNIQIINGYGPTEDTICATFLKYSSKTHTGNNVSIGNPVSNTRIYILDKNNNLNPLGVPGELCISGSGLARGYLNRPELTEEKFVDNPFMAGMRMYRTGDLARWLPDGNIEFLGRIDNQVKIRGFRIELGEIESSLVQHNDISSTIVLAKEVLDGDKQLVAYFVSDKELEISALRNFLRKSLPDYMIPSFFIHMETLPLTPNGKIDRKALPDKDGSISSGVEYVAPENEIQEKLVFIWEEVLGIDKVGILDNFFELGGHSLKATRVVSQIMKELEVDISLRDIFESQTVGTLSDLIGKAKKKVYRQIEVATEQEYYDLSNAQRRLLVLNQFEKDSIAYNMPAAFILEGMLKTEAFRQAYSFMIGRHESLRTVFITENGEPKQKILKNPDFDMEIIDLRDSIDPEKEARLLAEKDLLTPFNLETGPLVRLIIVNIETERHLLLFNMHHIISDGWSMSIFIKEFLTSYESFREGSTPELAPMRIHYKDYSAWQNDLLKSSGMESQREYWLDKLSGEIPIMEIPPDQFRPIIQTFNGNSKSFSISKEVNSSINALCRRFNISLFMMLQGIIKVMFYKYTGQNDIIIGSPVAGRLHEDLENQIGFYVNTLVFRDTIRNNLSFIDFLRDVRKTCTEAFDNQDYPFDKLIEDLDVKRDLSRSPLFDFLLVLQNNESSSLKFDGLECSPYRNDNVVSKFDMTFYFSESEGVLSCSIEFNTDIYKEDRILRMIEHLKTLISSILENSESKIEDLEIIPEKERDLLLDRFNNTKTVIQDKKAIIDLFEEQVEKTPSEIAVVFEDIELSYCELNEKANIVAHYLKDNFNILPDNLIGVVLERSQKMIVAILGILKSGAAFVPIDPEYPEQRINFIIEDSNPVVMLGESNSCISCNIALLDIDKILRSKIKTGNPDKNNRSSKNLLYAIYTSGSTGNPKGVLIEQKTMINLVDFETNNTNLDFSKKRVLQFAALSFDVCYQEIFSTVLNGGALYLVASQIKKRPELLLKYMDKCGINVAFLPTAYLKFISKENEYLSLFPETLEHIIAAGEQLIITDDLIYELKQKRIFLHNHYGPSETHVVTTLTLDFNEKMEMVPTIGKPISNTSIYIVNGNNCISPLGTQGEICISGIPIGREYLNNPELTMRKFVDNPFIPGEKMYRTGDLGRWLPSGNIEFLGRMDNQVKIRGFRIELDEIESSLLKHNCINSTVVLAKKGGDSETQIVAYFVSSVELEISRLRAFIGKSLPEFMIPTYFIPMNTFPLTSNGKVDIKKLPEPDGNFSTGRQYIAPRSLTEVRLALIWEEILRIKQIGIQDNFFELGGHSLKATRVVSRVSKVLEVNISLKDIFENPTIESLSLVIGKMGRNKYSSIIPVEEQHSYELSSAQKRLWLLDQLEENSIVYNLPVALYLVGELNKEAFQKAQTYIIQRHESLRTVFITEDGEPRQKILKRSESVIQIMDLRDVSYDKVDELVENEYSTPFNLEEDSLIRFNLYRLKEDKYLLLFNMHHIISDGWSMNILTREFLDAYNSFRANINPDQPELKIQYKDYSAWQNAMLDSSVMDNQREYWLKKLKGKLPVLDLPADRIRPSIQSFNGNNLGFTLSEETFSGLSNLCSEKNVSLFMMIQTLIKVLIYRYTGQSDIIIGSPVAGRIHEDLENQIGFYINTLVFRDTVKDNNQFDELLNIVKKSCVEAFDNQAYPFDTLVEELNIERDLSRSPVFDVMLVLQNNETTEIAFDGLKVSTYETKSQVSKFDMTFSFTETENSLSCGIEYNTDIYNEDRIKRMGDHLEILISSVLESPESRIKDLEIIPDEEKNLLLNVFNDTKSDYPADKTIVDLFEQQVEKTPDNIAVVFEDVKLTYRELNEKANIVGHYLIDNYGMKPDDLVGVLLERSEKMIIALLGILKSGAAYVPLDTDYPVDRTRYMLKDSSPKVVLSERKDLPVNDIEILDINVVLQSEKSAENPGGIANSDNLAYIIYTSGSTGKPKGTLIEHRSVIRLVRNTNYINVVDSDIVLQLSNYAFDGSVFDIYSSLLNGAKLILIGKNDITDINKLSNIISFNNVSVFFVTTALFNILVDINIECLNNVRKILFGGEQCSAGHIEKAVDYLGSQKIIHVYGPTENTVYSTYFEINQIVNDITTTYPIGSPISNTTVYILDKDNNPSPLGVPGELCISGVGLARGYLNRPELTDEKFIENPFLTGERIYRTGDLARWLPDANIEFIGRIDNQVKIRGFRIELGEIENALLQHNDISSIVVLAKEGTDGDKQLIAYFVSDKELELSELRSFLKKSLPDYMIPSYFVFMEQLPLTPNGKIDRKALPEPDGSISSGVEYVAPRNGIQKKLVQIWQEVLEIERVGIFDNFFELGGHSLKATRVVSRISKELEVDIALRDIFESQTVETLSDLIEKARKKEYTQIEVATEQEYYDVSNAQRRLWVLDQFEKDSIAYNMPATFILEGKLKTDAFRQAYSFMIGRHESLRTVFNTDNGNPKQKILKNPDFEIEIIDLKDSIDPEKEARTLAGKDLHAPFNLETGPLVRFTIIQLEDEKYLLLFNMHHIISDGWSMSIFIKEFLTSYNSFKDGTTPELAPLRIHYKDYSAWQNDLLDSSGMDRQREYWLDKLSGELPFLDLPADNIRPVTQTFNGKNIGFFLPGGVISGLNNLCLENKASLFMMLQALVKVLLHRYTGQEDIILGSPIAGRVHEDLENQIGFYLNTLCLRDTIDGDLTFNEILASVKKTCTDAFDNQDYPFDSLVEELDIKRDLSRSPLFDVMLVLQNNDEVSVEFDGLNFTPYESAGVISKFDITFNFSEGDEGLFCSIEYNTDIYSVDRIRRMGEHLGILISSVIESAESRIKDLDIIPASEKNLLLNIFNDTKTEYPKDKTIVDLFEKQVEKTPDNIAVVFEDVELTYRELNKKTNIVGHYLRDNYNIKPDDLVGVMLERSEKMIIALLGILKSGAAYVPLDPEYPVDRARYMLKDSCPKVVLGERKDLPVNDIEFLDIHEVLRSDKSVENPGTITNPNHLAYIIYTSGSTGKPKGTLIEHKNVVRLLFNDNFQFDFSDRDVWTIFHSFCFDFSVWEMYGALLYGGKAVVVSKKIARDPAEFSTLLEKQNVTILNQTPTAFNNLSEVVLEHNLNLSLRYLIFGGEALNPSKLGFWHDTFTDCKLINMFGITETTVHVTYKEVSEFEISNNISNLGKPIPTLSTYVLDNNQKLLPVGVPGELCVAGDGVCRGYLNRDDLTTRKFINNPFNKNERLYRSGDSAYITESGELIYLGRIDNQVQLRGFRVELGEIENSLIQHNEISSAVVVAKEGTDGDKQLIAYFVSDKELELSGVRDLLRKSLPDYMVPSFFIHMETLPLTPNGKIDRKALPVVDGTFSTGVEYVAPRDDIEEKLVEIWKEILGIERVGIFDNFFELGGNSLKLIKLSSLINKELNLDVSVMNLYTYTTIQSLVENVFEDRSSDNTIDEDRLTTVNNDSQDIAIIGMSGRFPGAADISEYWNNLKEGLESIKQFRQEELIEIGFNEDEVVNPDYVKAFGALGEKEFFDAEFFGYSPADAEILNPQIRIFHEDAWAALENSGYNPEEYSGSIGIFAGGSQNLNWIAGSYHSNSGLSPMEISQLSESSFMSSRVSHKLNLKGPSSFTNTACSTSLVNIVMACENLILNRCDMALAGGVSIGSETKSGYMYSEGSISSPDGHCRAFSNDAAGTVGGEGSGIVLLKKLDDALRDNDNIHAVIKGYGMNNDGNRKVGFTAPSVLGQAELIKDVQQRAGIDPESITYIESHGTGTKMGDPIEVEALKMAFNTNKRQFCGIGSVKSNIGHLDCAAGVAGVIKTVQSLKNRQLPPTLHVEIPNPLLKIEESPFYINTKLKSWETDGEPLRAGVSSFGIGGTNAHIILEEAPKVEISKPGKSYEIINLSAKTKTALENNIRNLLGFLMVNNKINLPDLSYTLNVGRKHFNYRYSVAVSSIDELITNLEKEQDSYLSTKHIKSEIKRKIVFMFPGQGSQYNNMGHDLYQNEKVFRDEVDLCFEILKQNREVDFNEVLFGQRDINESQNSSCAIFIIEYALYKLLKSRGINPDVMIGHSLGEYTAACISGVLSLKDTLILVYDRGLLIKQLSPGSMLSVYIDKDKLLPLLDETVSLAVENSDSLFVVSGSTESIEMFKIKLEGLGYNTRRVETSHAFHSHMLEPILDDYKKILKRLDLKSPQIPYISNVTGELVKPEEVKSSDYWVNHFRGTVKFNSGVKELLNAKDSIFIEIGPGKTLISLINSNVNKTNNHLAVNILKSHRDESNDSQHFQNRFSELWASGVIIDWKKYYKDEERRRISLPTYAFDKTYYGKIFNAMLDNSKVNKAFGANSTSNKTLTYIPSWKKVELPQIDTNDLYNYLIFIDELGLSENLADKLRKLGNKVITVSIGKKYLKTSEIGYVINHNCADDYNKLFMDLKVNGFAFDKIIHSLCISREDSSEITIESVYRDQELGFYSGLNIIKALDEMNYENHIDIYFLSSDIHRVIGVERISPSKSTILGLVNVIRQEFTNIDTFNIDFSSGSIQKNTNLIVDQIIGEIQNEGKTCKVAYRNRSRLIPNYRPVEMLNNSSKLKDDGVYLLTQGLGKMGLGLSRVLAEEVNAKIVIISRQDFPMKKDWEEIAGNNRDNSFKSKIIELLEIEKLGAEIFVFQADVSIRTEMEEVIAIVEEDIATVSGVIHCADLSEFGLIVKQEIGSIMDKFSSKVIGVIVLDQIFGEKDLDFIVYCSSLSSIAGGIGMGINSASTQFMNSFSEYAKMKGQFSVSSINWPVLNEAGMAPNSKKKEDYQSLNMKSQEGAKLLKAIIEEENSIVFLYGSGLNEYIEGTNFTGGLDLIEHIPIEQYTSRPEISSIYMCPRNEIEEKLVTIWQEILGIEKIGVNDDFFELGGHSLKGVALVSKIRKVFGIKLTFDCVYQSPTISGIYFIIDGIQNNNDLLIGIDEEREEISI